MGQTLKMLKFTGSILVFFTNFCPIKIDLSGNTVFKNICDFQTLLR